MLSDAAECCAHVTPALNEDSNARQLSYSACMHALLALQSSQLYSGLHPEILVHA